MRIAFIDLETNGLPKQPEFGRYYPYNSLKFYDDARIVQIALIIYDLDEKTMEFKQISRVAYLIKPDGFLIGNSHIHHISQEQAERNGIAFTKMAELITGSLQPCELLIAHNILFDKNVLLSELFRHGMHDLIYKINSMVHFCTSVGCKLITKIRFNAYEYKQPKLIELYKFLFKKEIPAIHDALIDTDILVLCFTELIKQKLLIYNAGQFKARS